MFGQQSSAPLEVLGLQRVTAAGRKLTLSLCKVAPELLNGVICSQHAQTEGGLNSLIFHFMACLPMQAPASLRCVADAAHIPQIQTSR